MRAASSDGDGHGNKRKWGTMWLMIIPLFLAAGLVSFSYSLRIVARTPSRVQHKAITEGKRQSAASLLSRREDARPFPMLKPPAMDLSGPERSPALLNLSSDSTFRNFKAFQPVQGYSIPRHGSSFIQGGKLIISHQCLVFNFNRIRRQYASH